MHHKELLIVRHFLDFFSLMLSFFRLQVFEQMHASMTNCYLLQVPLIEVIFL